MHVRTAAFALLASLLVGCRGSDSTGPTSPDGPLSFVAGAGASDTIDARLNQALIVRVLDAQGHSVSGQVVRFQSLLAAQSSPYSYPQPTAFVARLDRLQYSGFEADTTDGDGHAAVIVALGTLAGKGGVIVSVPTLGLVDTAYYTILPGAASRIEFSARDTVALPGAQYSLGAHVVDRAGNPRTEMPTFSNDSHIASVTADGRVTTGSVIGRGIVRATLGKAKDSATVTIVPRALAAVLRLVNGQAEIGLTYLDGSGYTRVASVASSPAYPALRPDGKELVYQDAGSGGTTIYVVNLTTGVRRAVLDPVQMYSALTPRYSADGTFIYFSGLATGGGNRSIWRVKSDGSGLEQIAQSGSVYASYTYPEPSRDGLEVAFTDGSGNITIQTLATGAQRTVALRGAFARYSSDGKMLASLGSLVNVLNLDGTGLRSFGSYYSGDGGLSWCPGDACLIARDYGGLTMTIPATGETLRLRNGVDLYQASF